MNGDLAREVVAELEAIRDRAALAEIATLYRAWRLGTEAVRDPAMGNQYVYAEVAATTIAPHVRDLVGKAAAWACNDNVLEFTPAVRWFAPETDADRVHVARYGVRDWQWTAWRKPVDGWSVRGEREVWISALLDERRAVAVAVHEVRHLAQEPWKTGDYAENDARDYEARVERRVRAHLGL